MTPLDFSLLSMYQTAELSWQFSDQDTDKVSFLKDSIKKQAQESPLQNKIIPHLHKELSINHKTFYKLFLKDLDRLNQLAIIAFIMSDSSLYERLECTFKEIDKKILTLFNCSDDHEISDEETIKFKQFGIFTLHQDEVLRLQNMTACDKDVDKITANGFFQHASVFHTIRDILEAYGWQVEVEKFSKSTFMKFQLHFIKQPFADVVCEMGRCLFEAKKKML